ncbi:hypothetical protein ORIO_18025 [Cereibacter azotoformans]|uniref:hypothetical protein n=1 Tax=Cereibacter azotoformans TaxID=43057 RepID=UPI001EEB2F55|nr:hypothetical protein [Cereibacter azotoformans]ULB11753.1 hypothetical protein ORIO_18025 [Cereibacter azotoformans]
MCLFPEAPPPSPAPFSLSASTAGSARPIPPKGPADLRRRIARTARHPVCCLAAALIAGLAAPLHAGSLDRFLNNVEFCEESAGLRALRADLNTAFPIHPDDPIINYRVTPKVLARVARRLPVPIENARIREDEGHMLFHFEISGSYRGLPVRSLDIYNGRPGSRFYGFGVEFAAPQATVEAMFGDSIAWTRQNRPGFAMLSSTTPVIVCDPLDD